METPPLFVTILLAAGASRRMGEPKLFLPLGDSTLLRRAVDAALDEPLIVITGAYAEATEKHLAEVENLHFAYNPDWETGMSSSIATGIKRALDFQPTGFFIILADQPTLGTESLAFLADAFLRDPTKIVATWYPERLGVPAIFPARYAEQLLDGKGVNGARQLIAAAEEAVTVVRFAEPPLDVDTPEEYERLLKHGPRASRPE